MNNAGRANARPAGFYDPACYRNGIGGRTTGSPSSAIVCRGAGGNGAAACAGGSGAAGAAAIGAGE
jgi:hypothetical protein